MTDENESPWLCYEVEDEDGEHVGYWRSKGRALEEAGKHGGEVRELNPPDRIACEDDN